MKKKHLLRSILAIALCILMIGTVIAVGYTIYENVQGKKVVIDKDNNLPVVKPSNGSVSAPVTTENGLTVSDVILKTNNDGVLAVIPQGTKLNDGVKEVTLTVKEIKDSQANIELEANEEKVSYDIHIEGVANDNAAPIKVYVKKMLPSGLNMGNYSLYHVENGTTTAMTVVNGEATHNSFEYDAVTGDVTLYLASFSEVALVADTENAWNGTVATAFASGTGTEKDPFIIANADQLAYFSQLISKENDTYGKEHYKLVADVNLNGSKAQAEDNKDLMFYPVGYWALGNGINAAGEKIWYTYGGAFKGVFDGNGHKISNVYQNTWLMDGDYDNGYWNAAMGIFGYVNGGVIKNLTVDSFSSDGEFTPTGVIAAYAAGNATFENIAITNCNPRVYNTGNGGIIGIAGDTRATNDDHIVLKNITVDNSNKISALWGSWDVACGGLVGMYRGNVDGSGNPTDDTISFENCHVAAQIDVYNDVCANYQYYAYRYAGMIIGSVRHNTTNAEGKVIPNMTGISAEGCTVNYDTWNDYFYCELVANSLASYTHDHQFSRLVMVDSIDVEKMTITVDGKTSAIPTAGRYNYVTVKGEFATENATCYHFVDGAVWKHENAGKETVNGVEVYKEDNAHIYLPFAQLFTGYSWGVSSIGINNYHGVETLDITTSENKNSIVKFDGTEAKNEYTTGSSVTIGELFTALENITIDIKNDNVQVTVSPVGENSTAGGTFTANAKDWSQGTLTFTGVGAATITITDYYFCTPTTINVTVANRQPVEKFDIVMNNGDFLHRVGNTGTVALDKLFKAKEGVTVGTISVTVEAVNDTSASGTYSNNAIQFNGTGVVKVTITDNDYCIPTELILEVIDATNLTSATGTTTGGDFVLLCDVNTSTYVNYWNCTLYGNGFTYSLKGAPTAYNSKQGKGIIITKNAVLDNLVIVGDIYEGYGAFTNNDYYNTAIDVTGDTTIQNCYISGCAAPVRARNNVTIINSTLYGGTVGNLIIEDGTTTLENVTTANYDDGRKLVGMGIVIHSDATESAKLVLNGTLTQYNFMSESKVPTDTYAKNLHNAMFSDSCIKYHFGTSPNRYVNTGIVSLTNTFNGEDITDSANTGYKGTAITVSGKDGYVYTQLNTSGSVNNNYPEYKPTTQGAVPPSYSFDYSSKNHVAKVDGSNDYCYFENGKVNISMDDGDTFNWDTSILTIGKGITSYTVSMKGVDYTGKSIAFNTAGDYEVVYTYTDPVNYKLDENGNITTYSVTYTQTVNITVAVIKATTKHAEFTFGSSNTASTTVTIGNNTYIMPNVSGTSGTIGSTTVDGKTIYYPIVEIIMSDGKTSHTSGWYAYFPVFNGVVTITDYADNGTGDKMTPYNGSTTTMPSNLSVVGDAKTLFKYQSGSNANESPVVKNNKLVYSSAKIEAKRDEYNTVVQYSYTDNAGTTYYYYIGYHAPAQSYSNTCVTPDTLVTLADGTQVRVDSLTGSENLLVWNHETGKLESASVAYIVNHDKIATEKEIIHLYFSNGSEIKIIGEHVFYDATLNKYVAIDINNAESYIGHKFLGLGDNAITEVELVSVSRTVEITEAYEIVSYKHLTCFTNGILSTSAYLDKLLNIFDIDTETYAYNAETVQKDIEDYGLYTYADFEGLISEEAFELYNAKYLKIAVGKGYITWDDILDLIDIYFNVDVQPIQ